LNFSGPIMGSLKSSCKISHKSSIETMALNSLSFFLEKSRFGNTPTEGSNAGGTKNRNFQPISRYISEMIQDRAIVTLGCV